MKMISLNLRVAEPRHCGDARSPWRPDSQPARFIPAPVKESLRGALTTDAVKDVLPAGYIPRRFNTRHANLPSAGQRGAMAGAAVRGAGIGIGRYAAAE